ncbi:uncharacterized protein C13orf42 [Siniperca chuatsi]|uniref:uncharacterized protein C13orf42 n=1 Tax=Siniperca chuatsi TaxID=119488 RepID=UPI001CE1ABA5|nr:uncharacterized protein C13orf42 [Siniperca chuatsi]XP_044073589.1 uncharacterized protein C13orf42 [Siniperca chuatsi]XP_044073590.1 uncharacterized protein C13orf42 [Siniperca chuatsi]XP_044073591.1 uncharacterized protein C13orf42 [Siniperca chuatsi]XP_044073592.1 uncharacterized protein C13orf42 [Siniperca chuatsi]
MFRKINNAFRPNHHGHRGQDGDGGGFRSKQDYHNACTVRLVRSTSMLVVGEKTQAAAGSTLKRSKSTVSIESTLYYYQRQEDRIWLYSQNQNCLEYLEALVALRRQYTKSVSDLKSNDTKATVSSKKKPAPPPPPTKEEPISRAKPSAPPVPDEEDTLQFFDAVIASCDSEPARKPYLDDGHADVDFIVASSSAEHDLHSNWVLRVPRVADDSKQKAVHDCANESVPKKKNQSGSTSSRLRLQRNPIHLPKVVESAFQTLRFKPKLKKQ